MARKTQQANMVRPPTVQATVTIENNHRKTTHGITCVQCGSAHVRIRNTRSTAYPHPTATRLQIKRQQCVCSDCNHGWWRRVKIEETVLP